MDTKDYQNINLQKWTVLHSLLIDVWT